MVYIASADGDLVNVNQAGVYLFGYASKVKIANFNNSRGIGKDTYAFNRQENGSSFRIKVSSV
jgi:hypothetical protein